MITVGLTGGIASGKSTVSSMFKEHSIPVICADELAHEAVKKGSPALKKIREIFGDDVFQEDGELDRMALGSKVFADHTLKKKLEGIVHPYVEQKKDEFLAKCAAQGHPVVVIDVPLLFETGWNNNVDVVVVVYVNKELQIKRLMERNGVSLEQATARLDSQWPIEDKKEQADVVIDNSGPLEETRLRFEKALEEIKSRVQI